MLAPERTSSRADYGPSDLGVHWNQVMRLGAFPAQALGLGVVRIWPDLPARFPPLLSSLLVPGLSIFVCAASLISLIDMRAVSHRRGDTDELARTYVWTTVLLVSVLTVGTLFFLSLMLPLQIMEGNRDGYWT